MSENVKIEVDAEVVGPVAKVTIKIEQPGAEFASSLVGILMTLAEQYGQVQGDVASIKRSVQGRQASLRAASAGPNGKFRL